MEFSGKTVLITGASSGIGAGTALRFAKEHAQLALVGRNQSNLHNTALQCEELSGLKPLEIIADISKDEDCQNIIEETINRYGKLDVLINNAGLTRLDGLQGGIESFDQVMGTNCRGTFHLTILAIPHLLKTKGNIVTISSILSRKPVPNFLTYCMSKAALDIMTQCLALELGAQGVRVNTVNPGPVRTEIFRTAGLGGPEDGALYRQFEASTPLKRYSSPADVAELIVFLASSRADTITASSHFVDCGALFELNLSVNSHNV